MPECVLAWNLQTGPFMSKSTPALVAAAAAIVASAAVLAQHDAGQSPRTVKDVMTMMTIPGSDVIFAAASEPPKDDAGWTALRNGAQLLARSGRLLATAALARDTGPWIERAAEMVQEAEATQRIAEAQNPDGLEEASDRVYVVCEACHARYLEQP